MSTTLEQAKSLKTVLEFDGTDDYWIAGTCVGGILTRSYPFSEPKSNPSIAQSRFSPEDVPTKDRALSSQVFSHQKNNGENEKLFNSTSKELEEFLHEKMLERDAISR